MNKDTPVLKFAYVTEGISKVFKEIEWLSNQKPLGYGDLNKWLESRQIAKHRDSIENLLKEINCYNLDGFLRTTHGLSLNDTFWVKEADSPLRWREVSLYSNPFDEVISRIAFEGGLYGKQFNATSPEFGVDGNYKKCWIREKEDIFLLKGGSSGFLNSGLEPFCEGLASQVSHLICSDAIHYDVVKFRGHDVSKCKLFTDETHGYIPARSIFDDRASDNDIFEYFKSIGSEDAFRRMVVLDALILNQDRHRGNYGLLFHNDSLQIETAAPVFDHNLSLLVYASEESLHDVDSYLKTIGPKIGDDFNEIAHLLLTPEIKSDLKKLRGFEFDFSSCSNFTDLRKNTLNIQINKQIDRILNDVRLYFPAIVEQGDFSMPTEDCPFDPSELEGTMYGGKQDARVDVLIANANARHAESRSAVQSFSQDYPVKTPER